MEHVLLGLVIAALIASILAAVGSWRAKPQQVEAVTPEQLAAAEQRLLAEVRAQRETLERQLNQQALAQTEALNRANGETLARLQESIRGFGDSLALRFDALQEQLRATTKDAREEQDKRLEGIRQAFIALNEQSSLAAREQVEKSAQNATALSSKISEALQFFSDRMEKANASARLELGKALENLGLAEKDSQLAQTKAFLELQERLNLGLDKMRADNEAKLESIRLTVDEKLQSTLRERLGESFKLVSDRLEQVHKGLGEMQTLATGVGDLKRVLTNVRTRGTYGEVQLRALIEQALAPSQYEENVSTIPGTQERVEFAILLPGRDDAEGPVRLPIDAKFPQEDYLRLLDAYDRADQAEADLCRKGLETKLLSEAKKIRDKYIAPPHTTDFGILFVPTEGLFAEALRIPGLTERMQTDYHVTFAGPTTLLALLNSLQMGFQTLKIQKHSSEVWKVLGAVKSEFGKFGESLEAVQKNLQTAQNNLGKTQTRSRMLLRALKDVDEMESNEAKGLLRDFEGVGELEEPTSENTLS